MSYKLKFEELVDRVTPLKVDLLVVLRHQDKDINSERLLAANGLAAWYKCPIFQPYETNTKEEINYAVRLWYELAGIDNICLVTHKEHSYRAVLTAIKHLNSVGISYEAYGARIFVETVDGGNNEDEKIADYQQKGEIATYEEGCSYMKWLTEPY